MAIHVPKVRQVNVRADGAHVLLLEGGILLLDLPWDAALALSNAIKVQARKAEEIAKANRIVGDQAFLMRKGIPLGLSSRPDIMKEAAKEAAWGRELRRAIPFGNIESAEKFGVPSIKQGPPKKK